MEAKCVIGANFGDCAKGAIVNYLSNKDSTVVRFCSGANAGHTVCMPDGCRHVFGHIGSGTFKGASTHLSRFFICNPLLFQKEYDRLPPTMIISIDPRSRITTHYDMLINQIVENYRTNKHGSCGVGINETIHRHRIIPINFDSLTVRSTIRNYLRYIRSSYIYDRLYHLGVPESFIKDYPPLKKEVLDNLDEGFIDAAMFMKHVVTRLSDEHIMNERSVLIFEGAQGLLLDQDHKYYPHVTHSKTGLDNVLELIKGSDINHLDVYYVTRPYLTRHGEGPFPTECKLGFEVKDETNIPNKWQGTLRFGTIDEGLNIRIQEEQEKIPQNISSSLNIALTCCDQVPEQILRTIENCLIAKPIKSYSPCGPTDKV